MQMKNDSFWSPSTILDIREQVKSNGRSWQEALIGFRIFTPKGTKIDENGNKYNGWDKKYDEIITLWSPRIHKLYIKTWPYGFKGHKISKLQIDESSDPKVKENDNQIYAVYRPLICTSHLLIDCLNLFGFEGGYDKMLDLINKENLNGLKLLDDLLSWLGNSFCMYHRDFIRKFVPCLKNSIESAILKMPVISYGDFNRSKAK